MNEEQTMCEKCLSQEACYEFEIKEIGRKFNLCEDCAERLLCLLLADGLAIREKENIQ
jgi:hypothetical protein